MSERDPDAENAVNPNFNDDISDNAPTVVNMSATTSIYSQCSENSRNCVHLYAPELTRAIDTTHTSTTDGTRTKPMTEIFITNFQDQNAEFIFELNQLLTNFLNAAGLHAKPIPKKDLMLRVE